MRFLIFVCLLASSTAFAGPISTSCNGNLDATYPVELRLAGRWNFPDSGLRFLYENELQIGAQTEATGFVNDKFQSALQPVGTVLSFSKLSEETIDASSKCPDYYHTDKCRKTEYLTKFQVAWNWIDNGKRSALTLENLICIEYESINPSGGLNICKASNPSDLAQAKYCSSIGGEISCGRTAGCRWID